MEKVANVSAFKRLSGPADEQRERLLGDSFDNQGTTPLEPEVPAANAMPTNPGNLSNPGNPGNPSFGYTDPQFTAGRENNLNMDGLNSHPQKDIVGQNNATVLIIDVGPNNSGGLLNVPFVVSWANATSFHTTFWIETVQDPCGQSFQQLQCKRVSDPKCHKPFGSEGDGLIIRPYTYINTLGMQ